jgi:hypothetical protein
MSVTQGSHKGHTARVQGYTYQGLLNCHKTLRTQDIPYVINLVLVLVGVFCFLMYLNQLVPISGGREG